VRQVAYYRKLVLSLLLSLYYNGFRFKTWHYHLVYNVCVSTSPVITPAYLQKFFKCLQYYLLNFYLAFLILMSQALEIIFSLACPSF